MLPEDVSQRIRAVREAMKPETEVGFTVITTSLWASPIPSLLWKPVLRESMQRRLAWVQAQAQAIHRWKSSLLSA
jgi:hypothetical protein